MYVKPRSQERGFFIYGSIIFMSKPRRIVDIVAIYLYFATMRKITTMLCCLFLVAIGCKEEEDIVQEPVLINTIPAFYLPAEESDYGKAEPVMTLMLDQQDKVAEPWDLDFHPTRARELWILNKGTERTGGNTLTVSRVGLPDQSIDVRTDGNAWHFMALPSAMAFSRENGNWATTAEIVDANRRGGTFTGPSLWSSDMNIYARPSGGNGSHLDMLHGSPLCMGIAADRDNAFWVFDGYNRHICWYDFNKDHGPGNDDHSDAEIHRYTEVSVRMKPGVASHMILDKLTGWLYIVDTGNKRILKMNTNSGKYQRSLPLINEPLAAHYEMGEVEWKVFAQTDLQEPAGIEFNNGVLYVSDHATGEIIAYDTETSYELGRFDTGMPGIMGIKIDDERKLWFVNTDRNEVYRIDPQ